MKDEDWVRLGWVVLGVAGLLAALGMVRWPSRTPRCPKCRYDLSGATVGEGGVTCSECGRVTARRRRLYRHPRRWRWVVAASLAAVPATQMMMFRERPDSGWTRWLPTSVLVMVAGKFDFGPCFDTPGPEASMQLALYQRHERFWAWQMRAWLPREVMEAAEEASREARVRTTWPVGVPITTSSWASGTAISRYPGINIRSIVEITARPDEQTLGRLARMGWPNGHEEITAPWRDRLYEARVTSISWSHSCAGRRGPIVDINGHLAQAYLFGGSAFGQLLVRSSVKPFDSTVVQSVDEAICPVTGADLNARVQRALAHSLEPDPRDEPLSYPDIRLGELLSVADANWPRDVVYMPRVYLKLAHHVIELRDKGPASWRTPGLFAIERPGRDGLDLFGDAAKRFASGDDSVWDGWTLVIEGDGLAALRGTVAPKYWAGRIEIPFRPVR